MRITHEATRLATFLFLAAAAFISSTSQARKLQLAEIVRIGIDRSPIIKKDDASLASMRAQTNEYKAGVFPTIYADASETMNHYAGFTSTTTSSPLSAMFGNQFYKSYIGASQPLYVGGLISSGIALRRQMEQAQMLQNQSDKQNLVLNLVTAYYNYAEQYHLAHAATKNVEILRNYDNVIRYYRKIGRARVIDEMQADVNLLSARADQNNAESQLKQQLEQLRQLLALPEPPEIAVPTKLVSEKVEVLNTIDAVAKAMVDNPDILLLKKQRNEIANQKAVDLSQDMPSLYLTGEYGYQSANASMWIDPNNNFSQVMLELKVPLFSGLSSIYKRRSYAEQTESATRALEASQLQIGAQLQSELTELKASYKRLLLAREADLIARQALIRGMSDYRRGIATTQDVLDVQTTRYNAEKLFISTHFDYLITLATARKLMGVDLERVYGQ